MSVFLTAGRAPRVCAWLIGLPLISFAASAAHATELLPGYFTGDAEAAGADVSAGVLGLQLTHLATTACPCAGTNGHAVVTRVGPVKVPGVIATSLTDARSLGIRNASAARASESTTVEGLSLLGGLITASSMQAAASVSATATKLTISDAGSAFSNLVIAGQKVPANPPENTVIPLPGVGSVVLRALTKAGDGKQEAAIDVTMLTLKVSVANSFGLPVGATLTLGHAAVGYSRAQPQRIVAGGAVAVDTSVQAINTLAGVGPLASVSITNCLGISGKHSASFAPVSVGPISLGAGTATAEGGKISATESQARTTATIGSISLLGLIGADGITSEATETATDKSVTASTAGTAFSGLTVAGVPLPVSMPANTKITLPLLGYVIVNEQTAPAAGHAGALTVTGLHVYVTTPNLMNIPVGTQIVLARATATAAPLPE
jgi:hypothetical protein